MLRSGKDHLESLRDGHVVYIGNEKVDDVTAHPAFRNAAQKMVALDDMKVDQAGQTARTGARPVLALSSVRLVVSLIGRPARAGGPKHSRSKLADRTSNSTAAVRPIPARAAAGRRAERHRHRSTHYGDGGCDDDEGDDGGIARPEYCAPGSGRSARHRLSAQRARSGSV